MGGLSSRGALNMEDAKHFVDGLLESRKVVVLSKTYCPYCTKAKSIIGQYQIKDGELEVVEIERRPDCSSIQAYCKEITGASSVPRIFIGGKSVGGCDDLTKLHNDGKLESALREAGAIL